MLSAAFAIFTPLTLRAREPEPDGQEERAAKNKILKKIF